MRQARLPDAAMIDAGAAGRATAPAAGGEATVSQLVRIYREVGESIDILEARGGDRAARRFRDRYFRLPYGDALRIPGVRADTLRELTGLRAEVKDAIESIPFDSDAGAG